MRDSRISEMPTGSFRTAVSPVLMKSLMRWSMKEKYHSESAQKRLLTYNPSLASKSGMGFTVWLRRLGPYMRPGQRRRNMETGKYVAFTDKAGNKAVVRINQEAVENLTLRDIIWPLLRPE